MDKAKCKEARELMKDALAIVEADLGVKFSIGNIRFDDDSFKVSITANEVQSDGSIMSQEAKDFMAYTWRHGFSEADLNRVFTYRGEKYTLDGYLPRSRKFPFVATCLSNGKQYKFPHSAVIFNMEQAS